MSMLIVLGAGLVGLVVLVVGFILVYINLDRGK
jgi:hypothetical protein